MCTTTGYDDDDNEIQVPCTPAQRASDICDAIFQAQRSGFMDRVENPYRLARRMVRAETRKPGEVLPIYIAVQSTSRHYGGPEEGGWWYNNTYTEEVFKFWTARDALKKFRELKEEYCPPEYSIYSAANRGECEFSFVVTHDPSFWESREDTERPHYE